MPAPPYTLVDNEQTWLDQTDLVFIDPVGTGYSRAGEARARQEVLGPRGRHRVRGRVHPPLPHAQRALGLAAVPGGRELRHDARRRPRRATSSSSGIAFNGILLVSVDPELPDGGVHARATTCPTSLFLPTYAATAWYHKKLAPDLQADLQATLKRSRRSRSADYPRALAKGDRLPPPSATALAAAVVALHGPRREDYVARATCASRSSTSARSCCAPSGARSAASTAASPASTTTGVGERARVRPQHGGDPSAVHRRVQRTTCATELGYKTDEPYHILGGGFTHVGRGIATTASPTRPRRCGARSRRTRTCGCSSRPATTTSRRRTSRRPTRSATSASTPCSARTREQASATRPAT